MKMIISYMDGHTEIISISQIECIQFVENAVEISCITGDERNTHVNNIRSIVIA